MSWRKERDWLNTPIPRIECPLVYVVHHDLLIGDESAVRFIEDEHEVRTELAGGKACSHARAPSLKLLNSHKRARNIDNTQLHPRSRTESLEHTITRATDNLLLTLNYTHA